VDAKAVEEARKKSVAAGLRPHEVADAVAAAEEDCQAAAVARDAAQEAGTGASHYGGSVTGMLLEWSVAALWTLCNPFPEQAAAKAAKMVEVREGRLAEARARLAGTWVEPEPEPEPAPAPAVAVAVAAPTPPRSMPPRGPPRRGMLRKEATSKDSASFDEAMRAQAAMEAARASPVRKPKERPDPLSQLHTCGGVGVALHWLARGPSAASPCARTLLVELLLVAVRHVPGLPTELLAKDGQADKRSMVREFKGRTISLVAAAADAASEEPGDFVPHTADGGEWTHPDSPVGLLLALGEEAAAWPRQRRQAVKVLLALRPAAALVAMGSSLHEVEVARRRSDSINERVAMGTPMLEAEAAAAAAAVGEAMARGHLPPHLTPQPKPWPKP
jgi:hypothetical protein